MQMCYLWYFISFLEITYNRKYSEPTNAKSSNAGNDDRRSMAFSTKFVYLNEAGLVSETNYLPLIIMFCKNHKPIQKK